MVGAETPRRRPRGEHVRERAQAGRLERLEPLGQQRADQARQHVARSGGGEGGRTAGADRDLAARQGDDGVVALQEHHGAAALGRLARRGEAVA